MDRISITEFIEEFYTYIKTVKKKFAFLQKFTIVEIKHLIFVKYSIIYVV